MLSWLPQTDVLIVAAMLLNVAALALHFGRR